MLNQSLFCASYSNVSDSQCPCICDNYLCWPPTSPGQNVSNNCPKIPEMIEGRYAIKLCNTEGKWDKWDGMNQINLTIGYTNYLACFMKEYALVLKICKNLGGDHCDQIAHTTRIIELVGYSVSFMSLVVSLYIFFGYSVLRNNRTKIHKNLIIATLFQVVFRLIKYVNRQIPFLKTTPYLEICVSFLEYFKTAMFMWMFIEGLYLHNMITVTIFQEYSYLKWYFCMGWTVPALVTIIWVLTMLILKGNWTYYYLLKNYWIADGPRYFLIMVNLMFLLNIIRVLIVKLRESQTSEIVQVRKAVRAAILLLPLMGVANIFFLFAYYPFTVAWKFALWSYLVHFFNAFQGCFVAVFYCFLNGEVQTAVKNRYNLHMSLLTYEYSTCKNVTVLNPPRKNSSGKWMKFWKRSDESPEEKEIDICDLNHHPDDDRIINNKIAETEILTR